MFEGERVLAGVGSGVCRVGKQKAPEYPGLLPTFLGNEKNL